MINEKEEITNKEAYYNGIIDTIIRIGRSRAFIIALCELTSGWLSIICTLSAIFMTEVPAPRKLWII